MPQDLYERWLDLPPGPRPPSPHALLGLPDGQWDEATVDRAAQRQLDKLDRYADHPDRRARDAAARLMNEVARARNTLVPSSGDGAGAATGNPRPDKAQAAPPSPASTAAAPRTTDAGRSPSITAPAAGPVAVPAQDVAPSRRRWVPAVSMLLLGIIIGALGLRLLSAPSPAPADRPPVQPVTTAPATAEVEPGEVERWQQTAAELRDQLAAVSRERDSLAERLEAAERDAATAALPPAPGAGAGATVDVPPSPPSDPPAPPAPAADVSAMPATVPRPPAEAASADPLPVEAMSRAVALRELAAFVERPAGSADPQSTTDPAVLARRLVEAALLELRDAREAPPLHVRAHLVRQMAAQRVDIDEASAMADRLFEEWSQPVPTAASGSLADPAELLRVRRGIDGSIWSIGEAYAALGRRSEFEQRLAGQPPHMLAQLSRSLISKHEASLPGIYASVLDLMVVTRGNGTDEARIDATIRYFLRFKRPGVQEIIAMAQVLPPRRRLSLLADAASLQQDDAGVSTLLAEAERVLPDAAQAPLLSREESEAEVAAQAVMAELYQRLGQLDDAERHAEAVRDRVAVITATADGLDWIERSLRLAEIYHAREDVSRSRLIWSQADAAARRQLGNELEDEGQLAIARSMIRAGENGQAMRIISRVRDSPVKNKSLVAMIPQLTMPDAPVDALLKEVRPERSLIEAYADAASLSTRSKAQQRADLSRAIALYNTGGSELKIEPVAFHLIRPLIEHDMVDDAIQIGSTLEERRTFVPRLLAAAASRSGTAEVVRIITSLAETDADRTKYASLSVEQLADRGRPEEAEALERLVPRLLEPRYASSRSSAIGRAYLEQGDADRAAARFSRIASTFNDAALLPQVTAGAVRLRSPPLLDVAETMAARSQGWVNFFVSAAEALTGGDTPETTDAAELDPPKLSDPPDGV